MPRLLHRALAASTLLLLFSTLLLAEGKSPHAPREPAMTAGRQVQSASQRRMPAHLPAGATGLRAAGLPAIRGLTIGPIESYLQPGRGYGSEALDRTLDEVARAGGNWISLTVFGRVWDKRGSGVTLDFERSFEETQGNVRRTVRAAHRRGLRVLLVPHLWLESGEWRAELDPGTTQRWRAWEKSYERFVISWARIAEEESVDMLSAGVELRSWVTTARAPGFVRILDRVRASYSGLVTYAANWDDVEDTVVLGELDVIGINAFYPLHWENGATHEQLLAGGARAAEAVRQLSSRFDKPVIFTEFGYTARKDAAIEPWLWPEQLGSVQLDKNAQAEAYAALLFALMDVPGFGGTFVWRIYADLGDVSQEPHWGFSPWDKPAEGVLRAAFRRPWWGDGAGASLL
jgi:hypothetical protein